MTEQQAVDKVVGLAVSQVGYREGANNYNKYAAELDPLKLTYGNKQNLAWCGEFVLWLFVKCFGADNALKMLCSPKPTGIPLCSSGAQYFKDAGRWSSKPQNGAVVFFYVGGGINHTGVVISASGLSITTVEGNSSDMVSRRTYAINDKGIAGYGIPNWGIVAKEEAPAPPDEIPVEDEKPKATAKVTGLPVLRRGDVSECVRAAQSLLNTRGASCGKYGADGDFGNATEAAVLAFQRRNNLIADGIIGEQTWSALLGV